MKKQNNYLKSFLFVTVAAFAVFLSLSDTLSDGANSAWICTKESVEQTVKSESECETETHHDKEREFLESMGKKSFSETKLRETWKDVLSMPSEEDFDMPVTSWVSIGPYGIRRSSSSELYSGRILDIEVEGVPSTRVASASGGLWRFAGPFPVPVSDNVSCLSIGSFVSNTQDPNTIIIGTGEPEPMYPYPGPGGAGTGGPGNGIWKTVNGGTNWTQVMLTPPPAAFYKVRYQPGSFSRVHAATNTGYYRSTNAGNSWTILFAGKITDLAFRPDMPAVIYIANYGDGLYRTTNGGDNFSKITNFPVNSVDFGRASISFCNNYPSFVYVAVSNQVGGGRTKGIYRTIDGGLNWTDVSFDVPGDYYWDQGNYNNCIAVCPTNPNLVLLGAGGILRTTNGGTNWTQYLSIPNTENLHADQHVIVWHSDGLRVWLGNDGGLAYSGDAGETWDVSANMLPITQFWDFDIGVSGTNFTVAGGTQDNAFPYSTNCTITASGIWHLGLGGDAGSSKVDKFNAQRIIGICGCPASPIQRTTDGGTTWSSANGGLNIDSVLSNIEDDRAGSNPAYPYIANLRKVFYSTNFGLNWNQLGTATLPSTIWRINVSRFGSGGNIVYAIINNGTDYIKVYESGSWYSRNTGLPAPIQFVAQHPTDNAKAYAITFENGSPQKIFKTTNKGVNWTNITGDLPNVPISDLMPHPTNDNILYAACRMGPCGMFKTTNGGMNWIRWTYGMPGANEIVRLKIIDSSAINGRFYIVAASHGRGVWVREGSGDDPIGIKPVSGNIPSHYQLKQNYPNPFNPVTTIQFSLPVKDHVEMKLFDINGREVLSVVNGGYNPGIHDIKFDGSNLSSGIYFYRIVTSKFTDTKKMMIVK